MPYAGPGGAKSSDPAFEYFEIEKQGPQQLLIRVTRSLDLVDLTFDLDGFSFKERRNHLSQDRKRALITVFFPPQHIAETVFDKPVDDKGNRVCCRPEQDPWQPSLRAAPASRLVFETKQRNATSKPLHLETLLDWRKLKLKVSPRARSIEVTGKPGWREPREDLQSQLKVLFPPEDGEDDAAWEARVREIPIRDWLGELTKIFGAPDANETALHVADRLVFSPSDLSSWECYPDTRRVRDFKQYGNSVPAWSARLNGVGRKSVRAIHSHVFDDLPGGLGLPSAGVIADRSDPEMALTARHHWDIVAQTSLPGLPALLSIALETRAGDDGNSADRTQPDTAEEAAAGEVPRSRVVLPHIAYKFLGKLNEISPDTGIALTKPFDDADIILTTLGANTRMRWKGEPPRLRLYDPDNPPDNKDPYTLFEGFDLERLLLATYLGRDSQIEAVEKGFLFPLGIRASLVTIVERHIYKNWQGQPGSFECRRRVIVANDRVKHFPGPYHPQDAREFPATRARITTDKTPDLFDCHNVFEGELPDYTIFWPRIAAEDTARRVDGNETGNGVDFEFMWETDDAVARSNLVFVINSKLGNEHLMRRLVKEYNSLDNPRRRTALLDGARHRYARPSRPGNTSFSTHSWLLKASGRKDGPQSSEHFVMDGRMEGADQPPFYPMLEQAEISVQSVDQVLGEAQGRIGVSYFPDYVRDDFPADRPRNDGEPVAEDNKAEIYLQVTAGKVALQADKKANRTGGMAAPVFDVAAMARKTGLVGGDDTGAAATRGGAKYDFGKAKAGKFDPSQFFKGPKAARLEADGAGHVETGPIDAEGGNPLANLFGILDLLKLDLGADGVNIDGVNSPKLRESFQFGARESTLVKSVAERLLKVLYAADGVVPAIDQAIRTANARLAGATGKRKIGVALTVEALLGKRLARVLGRLRGTAGTSVQSLLEAVRDDPSIGTIKEVADFVEEFASAGGAFIDDPIPDEVVKTLKLVQGLIDSLRKGMLVATLVGQLRQELETRARAELCAAIGDAEEYAGIVFGEFGYEASGHFKSCEEIFADPGRALAAMGEGLLGGALDATRSQAEDRVWGFAEAYLLQLHDAAAVVEVDLALLRADLERRALDVLVELATELEPYNPTKADLRDRTFLRAKLIEPAQTEIGAIIERVFAEAVEPAKADTDQPDNALAQALGKVGQRIDSLEERSHTKLRELLLRSTVIEGLRPKDQAKLHDLAERIADELHENVVRPHAIAPLEKMETRLLRSVAAGGIKAKDAIVRLTDALIAIYRASAIPAHFDEFAELVEQVKAAVLALVHEAVAAQQKLEEALDTVEAKTLALPEDPWEVGRVREAVLENIAEARTTLSAFEQQRAKIPADIADLDPDKLEPLAGALRLRAQLLAEAGAILDPLIRLAPESAAEDKARDDLFAAAKALIEAVAQIADAGFDWSDIRGSIAKIRTLAEANPPEEYLSALEGALESTVARAEAFRDAMGQVLAGDFAELHAAVMKEGAALLASIDKDLAGRLVQTVLFAQSNLQALGEQAKQALQAIWTSGTAPIRAYLDGLKSMLATVRSEIVEQIKNPVIEALIQIVTGGKADVLNERIDTLVGAVEVLLGRLDDLGQAPPDTFVDEVEKVRDDFDQTVTAFKDLDDFISSIAIEDSMNWLGTQLRSLLEAVRDELEELALSFIPTHITTGYDWRTKLDGFCNFKPVESLPLLEKKDGVWMPILDDDNKKVEEHHLHVRSEFSFDVLKKELKTKVSGELAPFDLFVFSPSLNIVTIRFGTCSFETENGKSPDYKMPIDTVTPGPYIKFLEPLQQWLAPKGNGFYLKPQFGPPGIEAGYIYNAGVVQLGTLQFINLAFGVSASIYFDGSPAQYAFNLGSSSLPFMVANPPYGGGGWIKLTSKADGSNTLKLSIFFGGVSALKFGPLNAQGRVVAGLAVKDQGENNQVLWAYFEAAGRGTIACFSLTCTIRISLIQEGSGRMYGETAYSFEFSVGIAEYEYRVNARYKMSNGKSSGVAALGDGRRAAFLAGVPKATTTMHVPAKQKRWKSYVETIDLEAVQ
ncbi:MAG: hypothetical protein ABJM58_12195 [Alteripontixanthobacter sp.]